MAQSSETGRYPTARHWHALYLRERGRYDEATAELERALELDPLSLPLHLALGSTHHSAGRYPEAMRAYDRALEFEPHAPGVHFNRADLLLTLERYDEAMEIAERAIDERDPYAGQFKRDPKCAPLRAHPRYPELAARVAPE